MQPGLLERMLAVEQNHWWMRARQEILLALLRRWVPAGGRVLDVGCGTGFLAAAASKEWEVWGLDPAPEAVAFCRARGLHRVQQASVADLGTGMFPACDAVCFFDVLEHLDDDLAALRGAVRNLAKGGRVLVSVPAYAWLWSSHDLTHHHRRRYTRSSLQNAFEAAGLVPVILGYFNTRLFPIAAASRLWNRWTRAQPGSVLLPLPPAPVNALLRRVFASEAHRLSGPTPRPFRYGLSVLAVGQASEELSWRGRAAGGV